MNFVTHRILNPTDGGQTFEDWVQGYLNKLAEQQKKEADCGKEMGECNNAGKVTDKHDEAAPGDDKNKDCKVLINNDPNYQKGESVDGVKGKADKKEVKPEKKEASVTAAVKQDKDEAKPKKPINTEGEEAMTNDPKLPEKDKKAAKKAPVKQASKSQFKKVACLNRQEKLSLFAALSANQKNPLPYVEAMVGLKYANLTDEEKTWMKKYWTVLYGEAYAAEMVKDR